MVIDPVFSLAILSCMKEKKQQITLETLAEMIAIGSAKTDALTENLTAVSRKTDTLADLIAQGFAKTDALAETVNKGFAKVEILEKTVVQNSTDIASLSRDVENLAQMTARGFEKSDKRFDLLARELIRHGDDIHVIKNSIRSLERSNLHIHEKLEKHDVRISRLELKTR